MAQAPCGADCHGLCGYLEEPRELSSLPSRLLIFGVLILFQVLLLPERNERSQQTVGPLNQPQHPLFIFKESVLTSQASPEKAGDKTGGGQAMSHAGEITLKSLSTGLQSLYIGSF